MTTKEVAAMLTQRAYGSEVTREETKQFAEAGIVVVYGYSDDCVEFVGAVESEIGVWNERDIPLLNGEPFFVPCADDCEDNHCVLLKETSKRLKHIYSKFSGNGWEFDADFPHEKFCIFEDGDIFGEGLVYALADLKGEQDG
ncbi:MAG: hypothetical protein E7319_02255 [Clostridiales bacterium]|nr:hypothetical protein [Clostridiales bacterium]